MNCDEPPSQKNRHPFLYIKIPTSFQKPSAVCVLWLLFACIQLSVLKEPEEKSDLIFIGLGNVNFILLTEWQEESYKCLRWSELSSTSSLKLFIPYYLSADLFVVLSIKLCTYQSHFPDTAANWLNAHTVAHRLLLRIINCISHAN
jgi:hypothetical protein